MHMDSVWAQKQKVVGYPGTCPIITTSGSISVGGSYNAHSHRADAVIVPVSVSTCTAILSSEHGW